MNKNYIKDYIKYKNLYLIEKQKLLIGGGEKEEKEKRDISNALQDTSLQLSSFETDLKILCNPIAKSYSSLMIGGPLMGLHWMLNYTTCYKVLPKLTSLLDKLLDAKTKPQIFRLFNEARKNIKDKRENPLLDFYLMMYPKTTSKEKIKKMLGDGDSDKNNQRIYDIYINASKKPKKQNKRMRGGGVPVEDQLGILAIMALFLCIWISTLKYSNSHDPDEGTWNDDDVDQLTLYEREDDPFARNDRNPQSPKGVDNFPFW